MGKAAMSKVRESMDVCAKIKLVIFDFDGVFTDNAVYTDEDGKEFVRCTRADGFGLRMLREIGVDAVVLSMETNPVVSTRCKKLHIACIQGCSDKVSVFRELCASRSVTPQEVAFVGNDINDIELLRLVGFPVAVADAYPEVRAVAKWTTTKLGGYGAVREFCEYVYKAKVHHA
ncbi:MAG: HAD hydrolase family protein [Candidatus Latescibacteria bacterium]|nr:HAD hydrolase family protein [Candidatus Latescibacterota bacterium]